MLISCGDNKHIGEAKTPAVSSAMKGKNYKDVIEEFEKRGFNNIKTEKIDDLIVGWLKKEGEVKEVSVGGDVDYSADKWIWQNSLCWDCCVKIAPKQKEMTQILEKRLSHFCFHGILICSGYFIALRNFFLYSEGRIPVFL